MFLFDETFIHLKKECIAHGFTVRGNAFFRVWGDGVLQVLKYGYERTIPGYELRMGLFSMYGELEKQWFTSLGCIPRYLVVNLIGKPDSVIVHAMGDHREYETISPKEQLEVLNAKGFSWLDSIDTQKQLAEAIEHLDSRRNDYLKFAPYLASGNYSAAARVMSAILAQHKDACESNMKRMSAEDAEKYRQRSERQDTPLLQKLEMAENADPDRIRAYLEENYTRNLKYAKFCLKR